MLFELFGRNWEFHTDIELSDRNIDTQIREPLEVLLDGGWHPAEDEMALDAKPVNGYLLRLELLDEVVVGVRLGVQTLDVVVIELSKQIVEFFARSPSKMKGDGRKAWSWGRLCERREERFQSIACRESCRTRSDGRFHRLRKPLHR